MSNWDCFVNEISDPAFILQSGNLIASNNRLDEFLCTAIGNDALHQTLEWLKEKPDTSGFGKLVLNTEKDDQQICVYFTCMHSDVVHRDTKFVILKLNDGVEENEWNDKEKLQRDLYHHQHKLEQAKIQLMKQEKMATLGELITGIVHEIFNPLGFIMSNMSSLKSYSDDMMKVIDALEEDDALRVLKKSVDYDYIRSDMVDIFGDIDEGIQRINGIIKSLKYFSRQGDSSEFSEYDLNNGIRTSLVVAKNEYKYHADIVTILDELPLIYANGNRVNQVILNLIINATHAIKEKKSDEKGIITIKTYVLGEHVVLEIEDTGIGMSDDIKNHIFEPFFTTKAEGVGTGLGLSIAYDIIVEQHQGVIELESAEGKGTVFYIKLPFGNHVESEEVLL